MGQSGWQRTVDQVDAATAYAAPASRWEARAGGPDDGVGAALMLLAHCAYHLGESRRILGVLRAESAEPRSEA
ncbi:MAG: hypothetical protein IT318_02920 [Anaerolineales bacterium]|nr:hypothetical protein [Anaerolineales bacterium]